MRRKLTEKCEESKRFIGFVIRHFFADDCTYRASALTFTTLLAIVPLMSVGFAILSSFPIFHDLSGSAQDFIFDNFVPSTGKVIQTYLQSFTNQVSKLSPTGVIFLFVAALLVMYTIESAMNTIWRASKSRNSVSAFFLYWAILSLAPIMLGLSLAISSYIFSRPFFTTHPNTQLLNFIPFTCSIIGFTFLYVVVPNCKVRFYHALTGGFVAAILFESAKHGFAFYLSRYNTYQLLYGAFATIPIFFIWIYWVWLITLIGAEIGYALSVHYQRRSGLAVDGFTHALLWLNLLWKAQKSGNQVSFDNLIDATQRPYAVDVGKMLALLTQLELIHTNKKGHFTLRRDIDEMTLYELANLLPYALPQPSIFIADNTSTASHWQKQFAAIDTQLKDVLGCRLQSFLS